MNKRQIIENAVINMINEGIVLVGDAVPSIRKMAKRYGVSITPVIEAYRNLEMHGILESRSKSGFVVTSASLSDFGSLMSQAMEQPVPYQDGVGEDILFYIQSSRQNDPAHNIYDFNCATLTPPMIPYDTLIQHIIKALRASPQLLNVNPHGYDDEMLVDSIAWCMSHYQCIVKKREICITNNDFTLPLVYAIQSCLKPNQAVLLVSPCDKCHVNAARQTGHEVYYINSSTDGLDLNSLERILIRKPQIGCLIINPNFQPPSGVSMSSEARITLSEICSRYNVCIIEDDRSRSLAFSGVCPLPIKTLIPNKTIYVHSLSFPIAPNIQMHWTCPGKYTNDFRAHRDLVLASPPAFMQRSMASYVASTQHKKDIFTCGKTLSLACSLVKNAVEESFPSGTYCVSPEGGCLLWVELPESVNCVMLADAAKANGISISVASDYNSQGNWIIINYSTVAKNGNLLKGIYKLGSLAHDIEKCKGEG